MPTCRSGPPLTAAPRKSADGPGRGRAEIQAPQLSPREAHPPAEPAPPPEDEWVGEDDEVLDETGTDAAELLASQLGAQIIDEQDL